jgi:glycosyltransferase involved in cell wall biosynthesis
MSGHERPRLLFVTRRFLFPADTGGKIRTSDILRGMKGGTFDITLMSPFAKGWQAHAREVEAICDRFIGWPDKDRGLLFKLLRTRHLLERWPVSVATEISRTARNAVAAALESGPDLVVADFTQTAALVPWPQRRPTVLFTHNNEAEIFERHARLATKPLMRLIYHQQWRKMWRFEHELLPRFTRVVAVSEKDKTAFEREHGLSRVDTIPTGVDLDRFSWSPPPAIDAASPPRLTFVGSMDWPANIDAMTWFMDEVWPMIATRCPAARLDIVGRSPPAALVERARRRRLPWTFTGWVSEVQPYIRDAHVAVIPLRVGSGTRMKVFEAMALGRPVISTALGVEGLPVVAGQHYVEADEPAAFADAAVRLLDDADRRMQLATAARRLVEEEFGAARVAAVFESICRSALTAERPVVAA